HFGYIIRQDTNYFLSGSFEIGTTEKAPIINIVMDTNVFDNNPGILSRAIYQNHYWPYSSAKTNHEKFLNTSKYVINGEADISLSKVNSILEMDTLDPGIYTYDSLCTVPGLPQSGFISLDDCELFVDIDEIPTAKQYQEKIRWIPIKAYPNPVPKAFGRRQLTLEFENTDHHSNMELRCYDDFGRQIHSQKIYKGQQDMEVDVSGWPPGIYIAVVYSDGSVRGKAKFVVAGR
ncbi:MAG: T9SS type A sorting domain-containing protein, partial [Bacteroidales bacterium]|nr:T9SS type A sorting domain-containing protein [Bacteroidales bacterium]